jgi:hypothetical protein
MNRLSIAFVCAMLLAPVYAGQDGDLRVITKSTETVTRDVRGEITGKTRVEETHVSYKKVVTENVGLDTNGLETVTRRSTSITDTSGSTITTVETRDPATQGLVLASETTVQREPRGRTITTTSLPDAAGNLNVSAQTIVIEPIPKGDRVTETWKPGDDGRLRLSNRTSIEKHAAGGVMTTVENFSNKDGDVVVTELSRTVVSKMGGSIATRHTRDAIGQLILQSRTIKSIDANGYVTLTTETRNEHGQLIVTKQITQGP